MSASQPKLSIALSGSHERLDNIELLRAFAVLAVMLFHYTARFPPDYLRYDSAVWPLRYGAMGVELFFIVSGYCIYMTATHCRGLAQFWARRISRLQPAYMAAILITFLVVAHYGLPGRQFIGLTALANAVWLNAIGYAPSIDGVYWSLIVEVRLYLFFGLIYFGLKGRGDPIIWWTVLCLIGSAIATYDRDFARLTHMLGTFMFPYSGFFLIGMLLYRWQSTPHWLKALAIVAYVWGCYMLGRNWTELVLSLALFPLCKIVLDWKSLWVPAPIVFVGFISYPLYLLHDNVGLVLIRETAWAIPSKYGRITLAIAFSLLLATLVSLTVEHRFRKLLERPIEGFFNFFISLPSRLRPLPNPSVESSNPSSATKSPR